MAISDYELWHLERLDGIIAELQGIKEALQTGMVTGDNEGLLQVLVALTNAINLRTIT